MMKESNKTNSNSFDGLILEISNEIHLTFTKLPSKRRKYIGPENGRIPAFSYLGDANADISKTRPSNEVRLVLFDSLIINR